MINVKEFFNKLLGRKSPAETASTAPDRQQVSELDAKPTVSVEPVVSVGKPIEAPIADTAVNDASPDKKARRARKPRDPSKPKASRKSRTRKVLPQQAES